MNHTTVAMAMINKGTHTHRPYVTLTSALITVTVVCITAMHSYIFGDVHVRVWHECRGQRRVYHTKQV